MNFKNELKIRTDYAEDVIRRFLPKEEGFARSMAEAMNYSMCAGGKRLRPVLLLRPAVFLEKRKLLQNLLWQELR